MEHDLKISAEAVRRQRNARGWSQDQLATVSGLSLRTIQRVEAEGTASMATKVSLAATFDIQLTALSEPVAAAPVVAPRPGSAIAALLIGLTVMACALLSESGRLPGTPMSDAFAVINGLIAVSGLALIVPAAVRLVAERQLAAVVLSILGMPLTVFMIAGLLIALPRGRAPMWELAAFGIGGIALLVIAMRQLSVRQ